MGKCSDTSATLCPLEITRVTMMFSTSGASRARFKNTHTAVYPTLQAHTSSLRTHAATEKTSDRRSTAKFKLLCSSSFLSYSFLSLRLARPALCSLARFRVLCEHWGRVYSITSECPQNAWMPGSSLLGALNLPSASTHSASCRRELEESCKRASLRVREGRELHIVDAKSQVWSC